MAQSDTASVWDRLAASHKSSIAPATPGAPGRRSRFGSAAAVDFKAAVCRDLEALLNTRRRVISAHDEEEAVSQFLSKSELRRSLATYGIPDFTGVYMGQREQRELFRRELQRAIAEFEPRFHAVRVEEIQRESSGSQGGDRTLRFRITGVIRSGSRGSGVGARREEAVFETSIEPTTCAFAVERTR